LKEDKLVTSSLIRAGTQLSYHCNCVNLLDWRPAGACSVVM